MNGSGTSFARENDPLKSTGLSGGIEPVEKLMQESENIKGIKMEAIDVSSLEGKRQREELLVFLKDRAGLKPQAPISGPAAPSSIPQSLISCQKASHSLLYSLVSRKKDPATVPFAYVSCEKDPAATPFFQKTPAGRLDLDTS